MANYLGTTTCINMNKEKTCGAINKIIPCLLRSSSTSITLCKRIQAVVDTTIFFNNKLSKVVFVQ